MKKLFLAVCAVLIFSQFQPVLNAQNLSRDVCTRPSAGSVVEEPADLRSHHGVLRVELTIHDHAEPDGSTRYCYVDEHGDESPTLRLKPGDLLILRLKDDLTKFATAAAQAAPMDAGMRAAKNAGPCGGRVMTSTSTNLHFHGLTVPPVCHQDDVLKTLIDPGDPPFEYRFRIPENEPPGLYWYHPHVHGFTKVQVLGGASGALIVEGIERADKALAGLPERVLVIRDQDLLNPNAQPSKSEPVVPRMLFDRDGDAANTGTGFGKPAKDLSVNFVPVPYPDYPPAAIQIRPGEKELWRVLNASAITYLNLEVLFDRQPQPLGLVALDGVPLNEDGAPADFVDWQTHLGVPPGARVEFIVTGPPAGVPGLFVTRSVDTGAGGENDPNRALATIAASDNAPEPPSTLSRSPKPLPPSRLPWLGKVAPVVTRRLYFSEKLDDPNNPNSATQFYITVEGQTPKAFDPATAQPNIIAKQGTVEDWIIENRSSELHAFHIHQLHFMLLDYMGRPVDEPFLRDTVNVPYYDGKSLVYPSVRVRLDFRDPNVVGDFVYHCHLLEHEDNGMMGMIRVLPAERAGDGVSGRRAPAKSPSHIARRLCAASRPAYRGN
ncbi:MAG TPA: multicopper oxidase domain-containing protein [Candidatus Acidoferrales bacterium]|nr:multicopper oxidase domain-containing protein [Candidatus Acidoferrales bacterium]